MKFILLFYLFLFSIYPDSSKIRVGILSKHSLQELIVTLDSGRIFHNGKDSQLIKGNWKLKINRGKLELRNKHLFFKGENLLIDSDKPFSISFHTKRHQDKRTYSGSLELSFKENRISIILTIPLETYVASAALAELGELLFANEFWPNPKGEDRKKELIAAQEIVIRSYILAEKNRHPEMPYEFCDLTHCVHFLGITENQPLQKGIVLRGEKDTTGFFHSTCGGILAGPESFWSEFSPSPDFRRGIDGTKSEIYCSSSPHSNWETYIPISQMIEVLGENFTGIPQIVLKDNRVTAIKYTNEAEKEKSISIAVFSSKIGKRLGWNKIKSNDFTITREGRMIKFAGKGLGHGIGLCQWGAAKQAAMGKTHKEILEFYFPGTKLVKK